MEEDKSDKKTFSRHIDSSPEVEICVNKILHHQQNGTHLKLSQLKYKNEGSASDNCLITYEHDNENLGNGHQRVFWG